tara:strand:- start:2247 stop:2810 length:564 start_codon:yes stop_codon:yes gene_type:complete
MKKKINIYIFARRPEIGVGKTRLKKRIGKILGANFYHRNLSKLLRTLNSDNRINTSLYVTPDSATYNWPKYISYKIKRFPQGKGNIGNKMIRILNQNKEAKLLIGSDIPHITLSVLNEAWKKLHNCNVLLGPAQDGGFWLIGFSKRTNIKNLFKNINWNRKDTLKQVKNNIHTKYKVLYTKTLKDID